MTFLYLFILFFFSLVMQGHAFSGQVQDACMEPQTNEPNTMNLQRVGQRAGLWCVNDDHQGIPHGPSLTERINPRQNPRSFSWCFWCVGGSTPPPLLSLFTPLFIVVFLLLIGVPRVGTCPISPNFQLLGVVVRTEKQGCIRCKALNVINAAFPQTLLFSLLSLSTLVFSLPYEMICSLATDDLLPLLPSTISIRGGFSHGRGGVLPLAGPLAQYRY